MSRKASKASKARELRASQGCEGVAAQEGGAPENTMVGPLQAGSSAILRRMKKRRCAPSRSMNGVPGVMQLESNASPDTGSPFRSASFSACIQDNCMKNGMANQAAVLGSRVAVAHLEGTRACPALDYRLQANGWQERRVSLTSTRSFAALNLRDLCWFILARGATPEQHMTKIVLSPD